MISEEKKYIFNNISNGFIPYCFFNGMEFNYKVRFEDNIKIDLFEKFFKYQFEEIRKLKNQFVYLSITTNNDVLKIHKLYCKNYFEGDKYKNTSIIMYENLTEDEIIKIFMPISKLHSKEIDINLIDFNSKGWSALWLYSLGFSRIQIANILKINNDTLNKRLVRIKKKFKNCNMDELKFYIKSNGIIYKKVPKEFRCCKFLRII